MNPPQRFDDGALKEKVLGTVGGSHATRSEELSQKFILISTLFLES
jgi:hypothetical protein